MKIEVTDNGRIRVIVPTATGRKYGPSMTPEEAVTFAVKLSNLAYPLTKAVQAASLRGKPKVSEKYTDIPQPVYREPQFGTPCGYTPGHCSIRGNAYDEGYFIYWRNR